VLLEAAQLLPGRAVPPRVILGEVGLRLGPQAQRAADSLYVHAEHPRALALAERRDREPREVAHRPVRAVPQGGGDLQPERFEVDLRLAALAATALGDPAPGRLRFGCPEEEPVEHQLEHAPVLR
jgi:hypothetical protein